MRRSLAIVLLLLFTAPAADAAPAKRHVRFTAAFALTREFRTRLVPASSLVGCTFDEQLMPLDGTTSERDAISATGSLDYVVQQFGAGPPSVSTPALHPLRGRTLLPTLSIERRAEVLRPAPCDDDAPDRAAQPVPLTSPCTARQSERATSPLEIWLRTPGRWALELPAARRCDGALGGEDPCSRAERRPRRSSCRASNG